MQEKALEHNHDYQPNDNFKNVLNSFPTQSKFPFYQEIISEKMRE